MRRPARPLVRWLCLALFATSYAHAQDNTAEARLREALRETADKLHATEAELAQQQLATAAAERERDALKQTPHASKADLAQAAALQRRLSDTASQLAQAQADQQKSLAAQQATAQAQQRTEAERAKLAEQLAQLRSHDEKCASNDVGFYGTGREIAALYRDPDFVAYVRHSKWRTPLGYDRVREENKVRALEDRFADQLAVAQHCRADATSTPPGAPVPPPSLTPDVAPEQTEPSGESGQ